MHSDAERVAAALRTSIQRQTQDSRFQLALRVLHLRLSSGSGPVIRYSNDTG